MSEIQDHISDASELVSALQTTLRKIEEAAEERAEQDFSEVLDALNDAQSAIHRCENTMPTRYTEVGDVADQADQAARYLVDVRSAVEEALSAIRNLQF